MRGWQAFLIMVFSVLLCGGIVDYFWGNPGLLGIASGVLLFNWIRAIYDRVEE